MRISQFTNEDASGLNIGDPVIITGNVQFSGKTGDIVDFGKDKRFVIVNLYNYGKHSFHASDVSYNEYADSDAEEADAYDRDSDARNWMSDQNVAEGKPGTKFVGKWKGTDSAAKAKNRLVGEAKSLQSKFEKHLKKHGYDVNEKSKYWEKKLKDIDAQIAAWDKDMAARKQDKEPTNEDSGEYYYETLAKKIFAQYPGLSTKGSADELLDAGWKVAAQDLGVKRANWEFNYDEDFPSDFVSAYGELQRGQQGVAEDLGTMVGAAALGGAAAYGIGHLAGKMINKFDQKYDGTSRTTAKKHKDSCACETCRGSSDTRVKQGVAEGKAVYYHVVDDNNKSIKAFMYSQDAIKFVNDRRKKDPTANKWKVVAKKNAVIGEQGVAEGSEILKAGLPVRVPHKGKMVPGKIVRYDSGKGGYSPAYVVDIGEYESKLVPVYDVKQGVAEGTLNEYRNALYDFVKSKFPTWPEYVLKDFLYAQAKGIRDEEELKDFLDRNQKDFGQVKWRLEKLPITLDIFTPKTQRMIKQREGGSSNPFQVPRDAERHAQQLKMIQQQGVRTEPIIIAKLNNGYDLIEGWHRTIQHLQQYPNGYTGPAWVAYGATYTSESKQGVAEGSGETTDVYRTVVKKAGKPIGEVGIDLEASPGLDGDWYMKHYASKSDMSGFASKKEALEELKYYHNLSAKGYSEAYDPSYDPDYRPYEPQERNVDWDIEAERNAPEEKSEPTTVTVRDADGNVVLQFPSTGGYYGDVRMALSKGFDTESGNYDIKWKRDTTEESAMTEDSGATSEQVASEIVRRIIFRHKDAISAFGPEAIMAAAREVGEYFAGAEELGTSDIGIATKYTLEKLDQMSQGNLQETASGGATGAGAIATTPAGGSGKNVGSLFGGTYKQKRTKKSPGTK